jgi:hypothetical protein
MSLIPRRTVSNISVVVYLLAWNSRQEDKLTSGLTFERTISIGINCKVGSCRLWGCGGLCRTWGRLGVGRRRSLSLDSRSRSSASTCTSTSGNGRRSYDGGSSIIPRDTRCRSARLSFDFSHFCTPLCDVGGLTCNDRLIMNFR